MKLTERKLRRMIREESRGTKNGGRMLKEQTEDDDFLEYIEMVSEQLDDLKSMLEEMDYQERDEVLRVLVRTNRTLDEILRTEFK